MRLEFEAPAPANPRDRAGWQQSIASAAQAAMIENGLHCSQDNFVWVSADFYLPHSKARKKAQEHTVRPDTFTLTAAMRDGLKSIAFVDEAQVTDISIAKEYAVGMRGPRVEAVVVL